MTHGAAERTQPYVEFDRSQWRGLRMSIPLKLTEEELVGLRGLGEQIDLLEVEEVYLPLARLIHLQVAARQGLFAATDEFLGEPRQTPDRPVPFILGVAGGVAVGSRPPPACCRHCCPRWDDHPRSIWSPPTDSSIRTHSWNDGT